MHHDLDEVLEWLDRMDDEIASYRGRMQSMCDAATRRDAFVHLEEQLRERGFDISISASLVDEQGREIAWQLIATRKAGDPC